MKGAGITLRSSNPMMSSLASEVRNPYAPQGQVPGAPYGGGEYGATGQYAPQQTGASARPMTVDDVVTKTGVTLAVIVAFAVVNFGIALFMGVGMAALLSIVGAIGSLVMVLISTLGKKFGSATVTLLYAAFEGLFVGGFSFLVAGVNVAGSSASALIGQAILGTVGVFLGMLFAYKTGAVKVTPKFTKIMTGAIIGVAVLALGNFLLAIFTGINPLRDGGPLAIVFSLVCIVLAALSFLNDFDEADKLIRRGAPSNYAWGVAMGLAVTLVWLYTEILRLLSYLQRD